MNPSDEIARSIEFRANDLLAFALACVRGTASALAATRLACVLRVLLAFRELLLCEKLVDASVRVASGTRHRRDRCGLARIMQAARTIMLSHSFTGWSCYTTGLGPRSRFNSSGVSSKLYPLDAYSRGHHEVKKRYICAMEIAARSPRSSFSVLPSSISITRYANGRYGAVIVMKPNKLMCWWRFLRHQTYVRIWDNGKERNGMVSTELRHSSVVAEKSSNHTNSARRADPKLDCSSIYPKRSEVTAYMIVCMLKSPK